MMRDDGKTSGGCWIYTGVYTEAGNMSMRRDNSDPTGLGIYPNWGFSWPANRRVLYNRASADPERQAVERAQEVHLVERLALGRRRRARLRADHRTRQVGRPVHHEPGGHRRGCSPAAPMPDGPFPEHYEPMDAYIANPLHPKVSSNPVVRVFAADAKSFGTPDKFPIVATSYRLAEHFHYWTKNVHDNAVLQPEMFVEMGERLAKAKGIKDGDWVEISSPARRHQGQGLRDQAHPPDHGRRQALRHRRPADPLRLHRLTARSQPVNTLTPSVGDASVNTPEYKAFLVDVKKTTPPARAGGGHRGGCKCQSCNPSTSAAAPPPASRRRSCRPAGAVEVAKLIDVSKCIGCKACQAACLEWNDLTQEIGFTDGTYNNPTDLTPEHRGRVMRFTEWDDARATISNG